MHADEGWREKRKMMDDINTCMRMRDEEREQICMYIILNTEKIILSKLSVQIKIR